MGDLDIRCSSSQDRLIEEQQRIMGELYKERQALAEEKTKFLLEQKLTQDKEHRDSLKHLKVSLSLCLRCQSMSCEGSDTNSHGPTCAVCRVVSSSNSEVAMTIILVYFIQKILLIFSVTWTLIT